MNIEFSTAGNTNFAMNPQTEKRGDRRLLRMAQRGCSHFLLFSAPLNQKIDIFDPTVHQLLQDHADTLLTAQDAPLDDTEKFLVSCISYMDFRKANEYIDLPDKAANYALCGCHYRKETDTLIVLLPTPGMGHTTSVAVEMRYSLRPYEKEIKKLFKTVRERTPFYEAYLEKKSAYVDGSIYYTIGKMPYRFPVTERMLGKKFLIRTDGEIPQLESSTDGVILRQE